MHTWQNEIDVFLLELLRLEGRGDYRSTHCRHCLQGMLDEHPPAQPEYRCRDCFSGELVCRSCLISAHAYNPFHHVEVCLLRKINLTV